MFVSNVRSRTVVFRRPCSVEMALFGLNKFVVVPVIAEWLRPGDLVTLDTSLCSVEARSAFHQLIVEFSRLFESQMNSEGCLLTADTMSWMSFRGLRARYKLTNTGVNELKSSTDSERSAWLSMCASHVRFIDIVGCEPNCLANCVEIIASCKHLEALHLSHVEFACEVLNAVASSYLRSISLEKCPMQSDFNLARLISDSPMLQTVSVVLSPVESHSDRLNLLNRPIRSLVLPNSSVKTFPLTMQLAHARPHVITELTLFLDDLNLKQLAANQFFSLATLKIGSSGITDRAAVDFFRKCNQLTDIDISHCANLTDATALAIAECQTSLRHLKTGSSKFTDRALAALCVGCRQLQSFHSDPDKYSSNGLLSLAGLTRLRSLHLGYTKLQRDDFRAIVSSGCSALRHVSLKACATELTRGLFAIAHQLLSVSFERALSDEVAQQFFPLCLCLTDVSVKSGTVSSWTLMAIADHCKGLHSLVCNIDDIAPHCYDECLRKIALTSAATLRTLHLCYMNNESNALLALLSFPKLRRARFHSYVNGVLSKKGLGHPDLIIGS